MSGPDLRNLLVQAVNALDAGQEVDLIALEKAACEQGYAQGVRDVAAILAPAPNAKNGLWAQRMAKLRTKALALIGEKP